MQMNARDLLAKTLQAEAGNQGALGMMSVGSVIMNRLKNPAYGSSLHEVILQPGQFSAWNKTTGYAGGAQGQDMQSIQPSEQAYMVADQLLDQNYNDPTKGATHYYNPAKSNPSWGKQGGGDWITIGDHVFGVPGQTRKDDMNTQASVNTGSPLLMPQPQQTTSRNGLFDFIGGAVGNSFSGLKDAITGEDADKSDKLAIALMSLSGNPRATAPLMQMAANDIQQRAKTRQSNKTIAYLETINPELAAMAKANPAAIPNIIQSLASNQLNPKTTKGTVLGSELKKAYPNNVNIEEGKLYNVEYDSEGKVVKATPVGSGGINIDQTSETAWQKGSMQAIIDEFKVYTKSASNARTLLGQTNLLESLLNEAGTGFGAGLASFVKNTFGVDVRSDSCNYIKPVSSRAKSSGFWHNV